MEAVGVAIVVAFVVIIGFLVGLQQRSRGRVCGGCGRTVNQYDSQCRFCGFDFRIG